MKIDNEQIASVEPFGMLNGKLVNITRLKGGLNLATIDNDVIGAASHQAILAHNLEQRFSGFQPMIMKSERQRLKAESHSHFLTDDLRKSGHDIFSIQNGDKVDFYLTKLNIKVGGAEGSIQNDKLMVANLNLPNQSKETVQAFSAAVSEKALCMGLSKVGVK